MASHSQRAMALILAVLFLATSVATGAIVIWQVREDNKAKQATESTQNPEDLINQTNQEQNMLKGTKLADFTPIPNSDTLQTIDLVEGTGETVPEGATITAHYTGAYAVNGEIFESSKDSGQPATFPLSNVIQGWQQGVPGMKVGGKRRLIIPGPLAYGAAPEGYTPGSTDRPLGTLIFDIELVSIGQ
jgi:FKBP-type peptidyl-prolyl cis-trans isomerase